MVGVDELERRLVRRREQAGGRGDDAAPSQRVEDRDLLLVEQTGLDDLRQDDVGPPRQVGGGRVRLDDADAVRDRGFSAMLRRSAAAETGSISTACTAAAPASAAKKERIPVPAPTSTTTSPGRTTARIASRNAVVRTSSFRHM